MLCSSPGAMDAVELARKLQEEATCSICLDYFTDPVMTTCGHNFCRECIRLSWEKARGKKGRRKRRGSFPCPECREPSPQRNLRPNRLLTKVAEMARQHPGLQSRKLCAVHQELLKLFCQDDQSPICVVCRESREHRHHRVVPIEEAVQEYKLRLEDDMERLQEEMRRTGKLQAREEQTLAEWQEKVKEQRERIVVEFEKTGLFLLEEEQRLLQTLKEEEEETAARLRESAAALEQQRRSLEMLLLQLEDRREREPLQMLQDMKDPLGRKNSLSVQYPEATPIVLRTVCRVPGQIEVLKGFQEDVVPDPTTAYPYLILYESRQRRYLSTPPDGAPCGKDRFLAYPCAVGQEAFSSGRHYWEVGMNLTGDALWALGVCRADVSRRDRVPKSPENGFWVVQLCKGRKYTPAAAGPTPATLAEPPSHVGIFLDFEAGEVSFYNVKDGSHLHTYSQPAFPGPLQPFFCLGAPKSGQMVISTVTLWVKG
ncbi:E3 ubiquitin-protein ligase TRIM17 [Diceros bicornis minor]|uniref:E3 ubiquitin-protein ligase TRIM17 n=1 Tax=Diceros bicornis minor TaxID=77932 RepID=UPI0026F25186|nr:E3 ubiquitin-protein ligase TRIM17 [Diceros bicornis minor]